MFVYCKNKYFIGSPIFPKSWLNTRESINTFGCCNDKMHTGVWKDIQAVLNVIYLNHFARFYSLLFFFDVEYIYGFVMLGGL